MYSIDVHRDDIMATSGATNGLHMIAHLLFSPGDIAFVENPTYFLANTIFKEDAGLELKGGNTLGSTLLSNSKRSSCISAIGGRADR